MALIIENGTGVPNANSYVTLEEATQYHLIYRNDDWSGTDEELTDALIIGTQSVELLYGGQYLSYKSINSDGPLLFPRYAFYDNDNQLVYEGDIPVCLKNAVCEAALKSLMGDSMFPTNDTDANQTSSDIKIGDIEISKQWSSRTSKGTGEQFTGFRKIDLLLRPILKLSNRPSQILR